ncbi:LacI family DNA-binding transcriptional regulator [Halalkalibacter sp. APA_J-10(15)]|uniref:LacI family DNA-binding transcriptional regulator n=1 Tax=Halalkalibacter sp. APA_J-10(15) TaxID=2933805 RepID=UPI001FF45739|nr:LacI family DNA-binding transcriptional regulator [Halalkalibacter sp. APA_J-10(15)]MCK0471814.1 LacI family transcriptional regulator [Halalkalibacter sp. APA_J-10(15)]
MRITIKDIARICGVSPGTVDRALNNRVGISEKTRRKVLEVAEEVNYHPNYTARSLVTGKTMTIGVVLFDLYNRSFAQLLNAIERKARELGYFVYITLTDKDRENELKCIDYLVKRKVDGMILFSVNKGKKFETYLLSMEVPLISIFNYISGKIEYIGIPERQAMKEAVDYMANKGYKHYIYVSPPLRYVGKSNVYTQEERLYGFIEGLEQNGIVSKPLIIKSDDYVEELKHIVYNLNEKVAIVCSTDLYALEVMNELKGQGYDIPSQVGVMGFDDIDMLKYITPRLTTVKYPIEEIGRRAVASMIHKISQGHFIKTPLLNYEIVEGASI